MSKKIWYLNLLLAAMGCAKSPSAGTDHTHVEASAELGLTEFLASNPNAAVTPAVQTLVQDHQQTATALLRGFSASGSNVVFSPYITEVALQMLYAGAQGTTQQEMATALSSHLPQTGVADAQRLLTQVLMQGLAGSPNVTMNTGTRLWLQDGLALQGDFNTVLEQSYGARTGIVDFKTDAADAVKAINTWVSGATNGQITQLLQAGDVNADTRMVLAAALYMQGHWTKSFMQDIATTPFHCADGSQKQVSFLHEVQGYSYADNANYQAVEIPYDQGDFSMLVVMPKTQTLQQFVTALDGNGLAAIGASLQSTQVNLGMVPFAYANSQDLRSAFEALGMHAAFDPNTADLSGITTQIPLYVSKAMEQAQIAVDKDGTQASAAAAVVVAEPTAAPANPATFTVDHPFLWVIHDKRANEPLFMGTVLAP